VIVPIEVPDWLVRRAIGVARTCAPERDEIVAFTDLSFKEAFEVVQLVVEAAADVALDSPEAAS
jgi:hypothetical protein